MVLKESAGHIHGSSGMWKVSHCDTINAVKAKMGGVTKEFHVVEAIMAQLTNVSRAAAIRVKSSWRTTRLLVFPDDDTFLACVAVDFEPKTRTASG